MGGNCVPKVPANLLAGLRLQALGMPVLVATEHETVEILSVETDRLHWLLAAHPERQIGIPDWAQPSFAVLSGRSPDVPPLTRPRPATEAFGRAVSRTGELGLEDVFERLGEAGCRLLRRGRGRWRSKCPICVRRGRIDQRLAVSLYADRGVSVHCFGPCSEAEILGALGLSSYQLPGRRPQLLQGGRVSWDYVLGEGSYGA